MKGFVLATAICWLTLSVVAAQDGAPKVDTPNISTNDLKWEKWVEMPRFNSEFSASSGSSDLSSRPSNPFPQFGRRPEFYVYKAAFKNDTSKPIKGVVWEYVVADPATKAELGRHRIYSYKKIGINKSAVLAGRNISPPSRVVTVKGLETDKRSPYLERIEIKCVQYQDDTMWKAPRSSERECEGLRYIVKRKIQPRL